MLEQYSRQISSSFLLGGRVARGSSQRVHFSELLRHVLRVKPPGLKNSVPENERTYSVLQFSDSNSDVIQRLPSLVPYRGSKL